MDEIGALKRKEAGRKKRVREKIERRRNKQEMLYEKNRREEKEGAER